jgi:hypothetical protein
MLITSYVTTLLTASCGTPGIAQLLYHLGYGLNNLQFESQRRQESLLEKIQTSSVAYSLLLDVHLDLSGRKAFGVCRQPLTPILVPLLSMIGMDRFSFTFTFWRQCSQLPVPVFAMSWSPCGWLLGVYSHVSLDGDTFWEIVVRRLRCCANIIECTHTNLDSIAYCTPKLYYIF